MIVIVPNEAITERGKVCDESQDNQARKSQRAETAIHLPKANEFVSIQQVGEFPSTMKDTTKDTWMSLIANAGVIILLTVAVYLPVMHGEFVWDDASLISENQIVKADDGLYRFWFTTEAPDYYPLTWSLWWAEWRLWGNSTIGYHVVNVLLHAVNAVLIWIVLRQLKIPGAWLAGLVFAVHPVNVATAASISEQKNTLSMLFYLTAILLYLEFDSKKRWRWYGLSSAAFLMALLSKTAVVMLPLVLLGCVWWRHGRIRWKDLLYSAPFFALSLVLGVVTIWFQHNRALSGHTALTGDFWARLCIAGWVPWFYLYKAVWPFNLTVIYPKWLIDASSWVSYLPGLVIIACFALFWWKRDVGGRPLLFGLGYFIVTLFPVLGFFDQGFYACSYVADHWQYCAIIGPIALVLSAGAVFCRRLGDRGRSIGGLVSVGILAGLGAASWERSSIYATPQTLWRDAVARNPHAWAAQNNLGIILWQAGKTQEAIDHYHQALQEHPNFFDAHHNLGLALASDGKLDEAVKEYREALRFLPNSAEAHTDLGLAFAREAQFDLAIEEFSKAARLQPGLVKAHFNLALAREKQGQMEEAAAQYDETLRLDQNNAGAHNNLGVILARQGRVEEAIGHFEAALRVNPEYPDAHNNLGTALFQRGRVEEAIFHFTEALRIRPDFADAARNLQAVSEAQRNFGRPASIQSGAR